MTFFSWTMKLNQISRNNTEAQLQISCLFMNAPCWTLRRSRSGYLIKLPSSNLINYRTYLTRQNPAQKVQLGCNILARNVRLGNGSRLSPSWNNSGTRAYLLISDQLAVMHTPPLSSSACCGSHICSFEATAFILKTKIRNFSGSDV